MSLLKNAVTEAQKTNQPVYVVLGANLTEIEKELLDVDVQLLYNEDWSKGIGTSIAMGVQVIRDLNPEAGGAIIMVCDQPYLNGDLLQQLILTQDQTHKTIVVSKYADGGGTPALFDKKFFDLLVALKGDRGASQILKSNLESIEYIRFDKGHIDLDTEEAYDQYLRATES